MFCMGEIFMSSSMSYGKHEGQLRIREVKISVKFL